MSFAQIPPLPELPPAGATGSAFNNPAIAFLQALRDDFRPAANQQADEIFAAIVGLVEAAFSGTSTASVEIDTGTKAIPTQAGLAFGAGQWVIAASAANPANFMVGQVTAYDSGNGDFEISVAGDGVGGSGTHDDWVISLIPRPISRVRSNDQTTFGAVLAFNSDEFDGHTASAQNANCTVSADGGTPVNLRKQVLAFTCDATPREIIFTGGVSGGFLTLGLGLDVDGSNYTYTLAANKTTIFACIYLAGLDRWVITGFDQEA